MTKSNSTATRAARQVQSKYTTEYFIERATKVHNGFYNYSCTKYKRTRDKVEIICPEHGSFMQKAGDHLNGRGCSKCSSRMTKAQFVSRCNSKHGLGRYDYSKVEYQSLRHEVTVKCNDCSLEFKQIAETHVRGGGCPVCCNATRHTNKDLFIESATEIHGFKYDYHAVECKGANSKIKIYCNNCKEYFHQLSMSHLLGQGCSSCHHEGRILTQEQFINNCKKAHKPNAYDYSKAIYRSGKQKVLIRCNSCNSEFMQIASDHMRGRGCLDCSRELTGYTRSDFVNLCEKNNSGLGTLYVIYCFKGDESFYKIGITSRSVKRRFTSKNFPYSYSIVYEICESSELVYDLESRLHSVLRDLNHKPEIPFNGHTECFTTIKPVEPLLKKLATTEQLQLIA